MSIEWNYRNAAHLLRRAGFGGTPEEINRLVGLGQEGAIDYLLNYEKTDDSALDGILSRQNFDLTKIRPAQAYWLTRMIYTQRPFLEKITLFWHGHFATSVRKVARSEIMLQQIDLFRRLAVASFRDILLEVSKDPAMIIWLDNFTNVKGKPNENYARELMELFSLGIGNYTEVDIREAARAFTGWTLRGNQFFFNASQHDDGPKTVFSKTGSWNGDDIVNIIVTLPAASRFITKKLFEFFAYGDPEQAISDDLANVYSQSNYSIKAIMRRIFTMDAFYSDKAFYTNVKSPTELVVSAIRMLKGTINPTQVANFMSGMEQDLLAPPTVKGWDGGLSWISTSNLLSRYNFSNFLATSRGNGNTMPVETLVNPAATAPEALVDSFLNLLGPVETDATVKTSLVEYLQKGDNGSATSSFALDAGTVDKKVRGLTHLIMSLPEFQLN
ncbi:DUF1800 domain-containing protein [Candidatus Acetothermia bacterium]|nr:DUF1800 domain-containing protein [Candidatus Acetothermia bacterium]MBI3460769.1 DUF1800 domain-containing protein [Candidatus Acetothermia bacterium]MBI3659991.1 DUF1800 domain-containing protein [Candidatus Acetothermia bacterium]